MGKNWSKNYPTNGKTHLDVSQYQSIVERFKQTVSHYSSHTAYSSFFKSISFSQIDQLSENFASYLQHKLAIKKGDRIALMCPNTFSFAVAMWGIIRVGAVQVSINPLYSSQELAHQLKDAQAETIVILSDSTKTLADIIDTSTIKNIILVGLNDLIDIGLPNAKADTRLKSYTLFTDALTIGQNYRFIEPSLNPQDLIFLQYTGGTTGLSKGAMLSHGNLLANVAQFQEFAKPFICLGEETIITAIPMYHIFALSVNTLAYFIFGANNVLIANPKSMPDFVNTWQETKVTVFTGVNTLFNGLIHAEGFSSIDFSSLKITIGGGAPVQQAVSEKWKKITGKGIKEGYGLSETSPILSLNLDDDDQYVSGIGIPLPLTKLSIRDDNEAPVAQGKSGELCAKGPQIMQGYWNNPKATAQATTQDGYFKTGDIAMLDDQGCFHIVDRKKDMILVSGFNVYPNEIEAVVANMEDVLESACIGVEHPETGEAAQLFVVKKNPKLEAEDIIYFCKKHLTAYKIPKQVIFIDQLPKSTVGKLLRRELRNHSAR